MTGSDYANEPALCRTAVEHGYRLAKFNTDDLDGLERRPQGAVYALVDIACGSAGAEPMTAVAEIGGLDLIAGQLAERIAG